MTEFTTIPSQIVLITGLLIFLSIIASKVSERFSIPALLLFLAIGMLAGSDGPGGIHFDSEVIANLVGTFALSYIIFSGGLNTDWNHVRSVMGRAMILSTFGVACTAALTGLFAWRVLHFTLKEGLLLGAIVSSTDAAAVFSILRSRGVGLKDRLKPILEAEASSNDPMAVLLTVSIIGLITDSSTSWPTIIPVLIFSLSLGILIGVIMGYFAGFIYNRLRLGTDGLYPVLSLSIVLISYGISESFHGNGFLAVYTTGIILGNMDFMNKRYLTKFHDGIGWLMQIAMFLVLGLLVFPSRLPSVAFSASLVAVFLMFVARPIAVYLSLWKSSFTIPERTLVAWTGLRGAVPIVLATFPFNAGYQNSEIIFNMVFFIVLSSILLQGKTLMLVAQWLNVDEPLVARPQYPISFEKTSDIESETREIDISPTVSASGKKVSELGLPSDVLILLIRREKSFIVPKGETRIEPFDTLMLIGNKHTLNEAKMILLAPHDH